MNLRRDALWFVILAGAAALRFPRASNFLFFAFSDSGSTLSLPQLIDRGLMPMTDFGYQYGLLCILLGNAWLGLFGASPWSIQAAGMLADVLIVLGMVRIRCRLESPWSAQAIALAFLPRISHLATPAAAHLLEPLLIVWALERMLARKLGAALALATVGLFVKPSMAYFLGLFIVLQIGWQAWQHPGERLRRAFQGIVPALVTMIACLTATALAYGASAAVRAPIPLGGMRSYRLHNFGFFTGLGRDFWHPAGARAGYYVGTPAGFWIIGSVVLLGGVVVLLGRRARAETPGAAFAPDAAASRAPSTDAALTLAVVSALLHLAFVVFFFGNAWSWSYYAYLLPIGLMGLASAATGLLPARVKPLNSALFWGLALLALLGNRADFREDWLSWREPRSPETAGLWLEQASLEEWRQVHARIQPGRVMYLGLGGGIQELDPDFMPPVTYQLYVGYDLPADRQRTEQQMREAEQILVLTSGDVFRYHPHFREQIEATCQVALGGKTFTLYEKPKRDGGPPPAP